MWLLKANNKPCKLHSIKRDGRFIWSIILYWVTFIARISFILLGAFNNYTFSGLYETKTTTEYTNTTQQIATVMESEWLVSA